MTKKSLFLTLLIPTIGWTILFMLLFAPKAVPLDQDISDNVKSAYLSSCKVSITDEDGDDLSIGTGVLLDTGYVITASHVLDENRNGRLSKNERRPVVEFFGSIASVHTGYVVYAGMPDKFDIAVIMLENPPPSTTSLADVKFGERLFTIGMTRAKPLNISHGLASSDSDGHARASIAAWRGNSGGGVWKENQQLAGIASRIGLATNMAVITIPIPQDNGYLIMQGSVAVNSPLANWLWYTDAQEIRDGLTKKKMVYVFEAYEPPSKLPIYNIYATMMLHILGVLFCASFFRKHLFG